MSRSGRTADVLVQQHMRIKRLRNSKDQTSHTASWPSNIYARYPRSQTNWRRGHTPFSVTAGAGAGAGAGGSGQPGKRTHHRNTEEKHHRNTEEERPPTSKQHAAPDFSIANHGRHYEVQGVRGHEPVRPVVKEPPRRRLVRRSSRSGSARC